MRFRIPLLILFILYQESIAQVCFRDVNELIVDESMSFIAIDFNEYSGDSTQELIALKKLSDSVYIYTNPYINLFKEVQSYYVGAGPTQIFIKDLSGDGRNDIISFCSKNGVSSFSVLRNINNLQFDTLDNYPLAGVFSELYVEDLNEDGFNDIVVNGFDAVKVFINNGQGGLLLDSSYVRTHKNFCIGNFDTDSIMDFCEYLGDTLVVYINDGSGKFDLKYKTFVGLGLGSMKVIEITRDLLSDLIFSSFTGNPPITSSCFSYNFFKNLGSGTFIKNQSLGCSVNVLQDYGDLNGDGFTDLIQTTSPYGSFYSGAATQYFSVYLNDGTGNMTPLKTYNLDQMNKWVVLNVLDVNFDDKLDLIVTGVKDELTSVYLNDGNASFTLVGCNYGLGSGFDPYIVELNGDSLPDFVFKGNYPHALSLVLNNGNGMLNAIPAHKTKASYVYHSMHLDSDNVNDIVSIGNGFISINKGLGSGYFKTIDTIMFSNSLEDIGFVDMDMDGYKELLLLTKLSSTLSALSIFKNYNDTSFVFFTSYDFNENATSLELADIDNDNHNDILVTTASGFCLHYNKVGLSFLPQKNTLSKVCLSSCFGDVDLDGDQDLVFYPATGGNVFLYENINGLYNYKSTYNTWQALGNGNIKLGDINNDQLPDLVIGTNNTGVFYSINNGSFKFGSPKSIDATGLNIKIELADFNLDGHLDIYKFNTGKYEVLINKGDGLKFDSYYIDSYSYWKNISSVIGDFNGDFLPDLAFGMDYDNTIRVLLNSTPIIEAPLSANFCHNSELVPLVMKNAHHQTVWGDGTINDTLIVNSKGTYSAIVTRLGGSCKLFTDSIYIEDNSLPVVTITSSKGDTVCEGESISLTANGAVSYQWDNGVYNGTEFTIGSTTTFNLEAFDNLGCSSSASKTINTKYCDKIEDGFFVSPNLGNGIYNVSLSKDALVKIYNDIGEVIYNNNFSLGRFTIDISDKRDGVYFFQAVIDAKPKSIKVLKVKGSW